MTTVVASDWKRTITVRFNCMAAEHLVCVVKFIHLCLPSQQHKHSFRTALRNDRAPNAVVPALNLQCSNRARWGSVAAESILALS